MENDSHLREKIKVSTIKMIIVQSGEICSIFILFILNVL